MEPLFPSANALSDLNTALTPLVPPDPLTSPVAPLPPLSASSASLLVIDSTLDNYQELMAGVKAGTEVVVLDPVQDAIAQITQILTGRTGIEILHIVSRGFSSGLQIGTTRLDQNTLIEYTDEIKSWQSALSTNADLVIYGSEVANDPWLTRRPTPFTPTPFLVQLAQLTGADIAASTDITGSLNLNGDWDLEYTFGTIESSIAFEAETLATYNSTLSLPATPPATPLSDSTASSVPSVLPLNLEITGL